MSRRIVTTAGFRGTTLVPRNPVARSPLLRRGGVHQETKTNQRRNARQALDSQLEDWREALEFEHSLKEVDDE